MPCIRHYVRPQCHTVVIFQYGAACDWHFFRVFHTFNGIKPFIFARDPILFWHLFEKATKYLKHIKFVEKVKYSNL